MADVIPISEKLRGEREAVLRAHLAAQNAGDTDALLATFAEPRIELIASGRVMEGTDAVRAHLDELHRAFPDQHVEVIQLHHSDDVVVAEHWTTATHLGPIHGLEPGGKRWKVRMATLFEFRGADLVGQRIYVDTGAIARQLA